MSAAGEDRRALRRVRAVLRAHRDRPSGGDLAYAFYMGVLLAVIIAAPIVRAFVLWLSETLPPPGSGLPSAALSGFALVALTLPFVGRYLGPLRVSLPELDLLLTSALPRRGVLGGRAVRGFFSAAVAGIALASLPLAARAVRGELSPEMLLALLGGGAAAGLAAMGLLLAGQLSRGLRWQTLRDQAQRLDAVSTLAMTGDFHSAAGRLGEPVTTGRDWRWRPSRPGLGLIVSRDLLGIARTPLRSLAALLGTAAAAAMLGVAGVVVPPGEAGASPAVAGVVGAVSLFTAYLSVGPWCRGLRAAGQSVGAAPLLPYGASALLTRHLVAPAFIAASASGICCAVAAAAAGGAAPPALLGGALLGLVSVALRLLGSLKGPLPQRLLAPVPTPAGDMAGVNIVLWNLDGPIWAMLIGAGLAALGAVSPLWAILVAFASIAGLVLWSATRLRAAEGRS